MVAQSKIGIIGVPQDLGASRRGVDMGPSAMRIAGLADVLQNKLLYEVIDYGNVRCHDIEETEHEVSDTRLRYLEHIIETSEKMKAKMNPILQDPDIFPLILGGDHSINIGTMAALHKIHDGKTAVLWVDAHADFNTPETTMSGNIHGMPFAVNTGRGDVRLTHIGPAPNLIENKSVLIGVRDVDPLEAKNLKSSQIKVYNMSDIDEQGFVNITKEAIKIVTEDVDFLHVSFDIDSLDPVEAPGTGTSVPGGLTYREAHLLMELVHKTGKLTSMEMVEVNPALDIKNKTAELAVGLIASALGKKIM